MHRLIKLPVFVVAALLCCVLSGCPDNDEEIEDINFQVGSWAGSIVTEARLIMREEPEYWCAAWRMEAMDIRLEEFQDGSVQGTVVGNLFHWSVFDPRLLDYESISAGSWDQYSTFNVDLKGHVDEDGYTLEVVEMPFALQEPGAPSETIDFWDFLFPSTLQGQWSDDGSFIMSGESIRPQGNDYRETSGSPKFREFSINYTWNINKL